MKLRIEFLTEHLDDIGTVFEELPDDEDADRNVYLSHYLDVFGQVFEGKIRLAWFIYVPVTLEIERNAGNSCSRC